MTFFTHPNFPAEAGKLLKSFDGGRHQFELFLDVYPPGTPDTDWILTLGKRREKPFILSLDDGMLANAVTRRALRESGCHFVYFARDWSKRYDWENLAWRLVKAWPKIVAAAKDVDRPSTLFVTVNCNVKREAL